MEKKRTSFSGSIGFVLAAAGSAVGLGNIWRFPYLAARDGGGIFIVVYIILALTFGFALLTTELAIGRKTKRGPLSAYGKVARKARPLGILAFIVPIIIMPYYCVIGGWVLKYFVVFVTGQGSTAAADGYFSSFISGTTEPVVFFVIFLILSALIVFRGVNKGIEGFSRILMPLLVVLVVVIAIFSLTLSNTDPDGTVRTGLDGLKVLLIPNVEGMTPSSFLSVLVDAVGQLFYSLSIAMGIMIAFGSYVKDEDHLGRSINMIEFFDTLIAVLAGVMIIPAVYVFAGAEGMQASGPGLMFIALPKVFAKMGAAGGVIGALFFAMVLFAALTSAISILEAIVSSLMDEFGWSRKKSTGVEIVIAGVVGLLVCYGYNLLYFEAKLPNSGPGGSAQFLDILDYVSNNLLMPILAIATCILIGWVTKPKYVIDEVEKTGRKMGRKRLYVVMVKVVVPVMLAILVLDSLGLMSWLK